MALGRVATARRAVARGTEKSKSFSRSGVRKIAATERSILPSFRAWIISPSGISL